MRIYNYKEYIIFKYENARGGIRWGVELNNKELIYDQTRKYMCVAYIESLVRRSEYIKELKQDG